jgi:5-methylcytosine-specific restriction protein A
MYKTAHWLRTRTRQLSRQPLCQSCATQGKVSAATEVDHVFAWNQIGQEAFAVNIFQSLCKNCHTVKTNLEQRGVFRHYKGTTPTDYELRDWYQVVSGEGSEGRLAAF